MNQNAQMVRHFLASLAYRFQKAVKDAPKDFDSFDAGSGIRTPIEILHHINGVLGYGRVALEIDDDNYWHHNPELDWQGEVTAVHDNLTLLDDVLSMQRNLNDKNLERLLQGPLSDVMTHVGQLAMLRRMAASPVSAENFFKADIQIGFVGPDQPEPVSPD